MFFSVCDLIGNKAAESLNKKLPKKKRKARPAKGEFILGHEICLNRQRGREISFSAKSRSKHCYILGATGCGKTNLELCLMDSDISRGRSLVVLDLRGDLVNRMLAMLAASGKDPEDVCLIDLGQDEFVTGFNPLAGEGEPHSRALQVLDIIRRQSESWGVQLEDSLRNCLIALAQTGGSLTDVSRILSDSRFRDSVLARVSDVEAVSFLMQYSELPIERQRMLASPVLNKLSPLLSSPVVKQTLSARDGLDLKKLLDKPGQVILVSLAASRLHGAAHLMGGLFVSSLQNAMMGRVDTPEASRNPVSLYIDEFENFASTAFESIASEGRRFKLSLTLCHQNLSQVPARLRQVLRNNIGAQLYFQTGALDAAELSKEIVGLGKRDEVKRILLTQKVGEAVLVRRGQRPVRVMTPRYPEPCVSPSSVERYRKEVLASCSSTNIASEAAEDSNDDVRHERLPLVTGRAK